MGSRSPLSIRPRCRGLPALSGAGCWLLLAAAGCQDWGGGAPAPPARGRGTSLLPADTLSPAEMLDVSAMAVAFKLVRRESTGRRDVQLRVVEDPLLGTRVEGLVGKHAVSLTFDAGSISGEAAGRRLEWRIIGRRIRGPHFRLRLDGDRASGSMQSDDVRYRIRMRRLSATESTGTFRARVQVETAPDGTTTREEAFRASYRLLVAGDETLPGSYLRVRDE